MTRFPLFALLILAFCLVAAVPAQAAEVTHDLVLLRLDNAAGQAFLDNHRLSLDLLRLKPGQYAEIAATAESRELMDQAGVTYDVVTKNMEQEYAADKGVGFGIYHTYSESVAFQDSLHMRFPDLVSEKWSIGQTGEGRDIWAFRVSANANVDEDEPEILIDGMHHAREIMASEFPIMFAEYLAENYGTDPEITWLMDNRELYVVPIVNPDGVVYNEQIEPNGGGMWRKNRRSNGGGSYGVDINRNYPYQWGYDNYGSSPYPDDPTYRGPSAGSEPETQALMNFINSRNFITHDTIHCYGNLLLYPWGYTTSPTPDNDVYEYMSAEMTQFNGYVSGQPNEAINYPVNGGTFDWVYGDLAFHDKIYSFSTEIGTTGFWPAESERGNLFQQNIWPHIYLMRVAGAFISVENPVISGSSAGIINPGESGYLDFTITNQSVVASAVNVSVSVSTDDPWIQFASAEFNVGDIASMAETTLGSNTLALTVDPACPDGHAADFNVTVHMAEGDIDFPLSFLVGAPSLVFSDDLEAGAGNFSTTGSWGTTSSQSHSPSTSLTDTPSGDYSNQTSYTATLTGEYQATNLTFWHRYQIEAGWDYGRVQVSAGGGAWNTIASYDGYQTSWQQVSLDLSDYAGQSLRFRFLLDTDYSVTYDGWYIDDIQITGAGSDNLAPMTPIVTSPAEGATVPSPAVLTVNNVTDPEGEPVVYGFRVYSDAACTQLAASADDLAAGSGETSWTTPSLAAGNYWCRAYAGDGVERSLLSQPLAFTVSTVTAVDDLVISGPELRVLDHVSGGGARLQLGVPSTTKVKVDVYDLRGARVRQLYSGIMDAGTRMLTWDGRDDSGRSTASGVYFLRMQADGVHRTGRVVVVR